MRLMLLNSYKPVAKKFLISSVSHKKTGHLFCFFQPLDLSFHTVPVHKERQLIKTFFLMQVKLKFKIAFQPAIGRCLRNLLLKSNFLDIVFKFFGKNIF